MTSMLWNSDFTNLKKGRGRTIICLSRFLENAIRYLSNSLLNNEVYRMIIHIHQFKNLKYCICYMK